MGRDLRLEGLSIGLDAQVFVPFKNYENISVIGHIGRWCGAPTFDINKLDDFGDISLSKYYSNDSGRLILILPD